MLKVLQDPTTSARKRLSLEIRHLLYRLKIEENRTSNVEVGAFGVSEYVSYCRVQ